MLIQHNNVQYKKIKFSKIRLSIHTGGTGRVLGYQQVASLAQSLPDSVPKHSTSTKLIKASKHIYDVHVKVATLGNLCDPYAARKKSSTSLEIMAELAISGVS